MSDFIPQPGPAKIAGLGPKAQKLAALREKAAAQKSAGGKAHASASSSSVKAKDSFAGSKKTSFNRKAV